MKSEEPHDGAYLKTEFLERIAHELRGPAGVTLGALDEIDASFTREDGAAEQLRLLFTMARRGVYRILRTAERLQRTAQLEKGQMDESRCPMEAKQLVTMAVDAAKLVETRPTVSVGTDVPDGALLVFVNPTWMVAALTELLLNGVRNASKRVVLEVRRAEPSWVEFCVCDDGSGFSAPWVRRFAPPLRRQGLGLSLSLVDDIVRAHQGTFSVTTLRGDDQTPRGARTCVALPQCPPPPGQ